MTAPDPTAGERKHPTCVASGPHYFPEQCQGESVWVTSPPAVAASTGTSEDVEALAKVILAERLAARELPNTYMDDAELVESMKPRARAVLASDWLAAREAAARAEERERIAQAILDARHGWHNEVQRGFTRAARIAREGRP